MGRPQAAAFVGAALGLLVLVAFDRSAERAHLVADGRWDRGFFHAFSPAETEAGRVASPESELAVGGLWSDAPVSVAVSMASALPTGQIVSVYANGAIAATRDVGGRFGTLRFDSRADRDGALRLRFVGDGRPASAVRIARVEIARSGSGGVPLRRWCLYGGLLAMVAVAVLLARAGATGFWLTLGAGLALGGAVRVERLVVLAHLPLFLSALSLALGAFGISRLVSMSPSAAAWVAASLGLRALLGLHPAFPGVDLAFHAHNVVKFLAGQTVQSRVASPAGDGMLGIPYPPLLYALVSPFASSEASAETALRVAMLLLEGSAPWLVLAILRASGASARAGAAAAVSLAVMPEGLLVLAKGVAANVLGSWLGLVVVWGVVADVSVALLAVVMAAAFLAHPGAAATLAGLLLMFMLSEVRSGGLPKSRAAGIAGAGIAAGGLAWLAYYRDVAAVTADSLMSLGSHLREAPRAFFALRGIHLLKIAQNLLLKMGGGPVALAFAGLKQGESGIAGRLLRAWLMAGALLAGLAVMTPLAFRFEYFLSPAFALAAGLGAEGLERAGKGRWVTALWTLSFAVQVVVGLALLLGRFELISVIIPSPRWGWPLRPW